MKSSLAKEEESAPTVCGYQHVLLDVKFQNSRDGILRAEALHMYVVRMSARW